MQSRAVTLVSAKRELEKTISALVSLNEFSPDEGLVNFCQKLTDFIAIQDVMMGDCNLLRDDFDKLALPKATKDKICRAIDSWYPDTRHVVVLNLESKGEDQISLPFQQHESLLKQYIDMDLVPEAMNNGREFTLKITSNFQKIVAPILSSMELASAIKERKVETIEELLGKRVNPHTVYFKKLPRSRTNQVASLVIWSPFMNVFNISDQKEAMATMDILLKNGALKEKADWSLLVEGYDSIDYARFDRFSWPSCHFRRALDYNGEYYSLRSDATILQSPLFFVCLKQIWNAVPYLLKHIEGAYKVTALARSIMIGHILSLKEEGLQLIAEANNPVAEVRANAMKALLDAEIEPTYILSHDYHQRSLLHQAMYVCDPSDAMIIKRLIWQNVDLNQREFYNRTAWTIGKRYENKSAQKAYSEAIQERDYFLQLFTFKEHYWGATELLPDLIRIVIDYYSEIPKSDQDILIKNNPPSSLVIAEEKSTPAVTETKSSGLRSVVSYVSGMLSGLITASPSTGNVRKDSAPKELNKRNSTAVIIDKSKTAITTDKNALSLKLTPESKSATNLFHKNQAANFRHRYYRKIGVGNVSESPGDSYKEIQVAKRQTLRRRHSI